MNAVSAIGLVFLLIIPSGIVGSFVRIIMIRMRDVLTGIRMFSIMDQFQAVRFSELETISLQAEMKTALRQAIDQLYEEYVGIHLKAKKFIDSLSDWGAIMKDSSGGET